MFGVFALAIALPGAAGATPQPSIDTKTTLFFTVCGPAGGLEPTGVLDGAPDFASAAVAAAAICFFTRSNVSGW